jgi:hypothetical protein
MVMHGRGREKGDGWFLSADARLFSWPMKSNTRYADALASSPSRFAAVAWVMLDWAASAFSTMQITLIVAYVERVVFADEAWGLSGGVVWACSRSLPVGMG